MSNSVDPITLEVVCEGLTAIVREMRASIIRASYSPVIYELDDFSCAIFNARAEMIAQSEDHPGHVVPMPWSVRSAMEDFASNISPGDILLVNDPYRGGTHLNDVTLLCPVHEDGELVMLPCIRSHWADVGGMTPGSYSGLATSIFQEGLRIPPVKLYERGELNSGIMKLIESNMRLPEHRRGDLQAMLGACRVAERRVRRLFQKYGLHVVLACVCANLNRCEARMRERIRALPDGTYVCEDYLEYYEQGLFDPVLMRLALTIDGDAIVADFAGSNPQVPGVVNSSLAVAAAGVFVALKSTLDPAGAVNAGTLRPVTLKAPQASIVNVGPDAPAGAHGEVRKRALSVALGCLAQVVPQAVSGDLCGTSFPNSIGGWDRERKRPYVYYECPAGGNGGFDTADGSSAFVNVDFGNIRSIHNVESLESDMPFLVEWSELRRDSGGAGHRRGGLGLRRGVRLLDQEAVYSVLSDRAVIPPFGILGGESSAPVRVAVQSNDSEMALATPGKATGHIIHAGDVAIMESAGGGGYGDPLERDLDRVCEDVRYGYVSADQAKTCYGTVIKDDGMPDRHESLKLRQRLLAQRLHLTVTADESSPYQGIKGCHRTAKIHPDDAGRLGLQTGDLIELLGRHPAPLRAWAIPAADVPPGFLPLDAFGCRALGVEAGDPIRLRKLPSVLRPGERVKT